MFSFNCYRSLQKAQCVQTIFKRFATSLLPPSSVVVGLPALSPTMDKGAIASWKKNEGDGNELPFKMTNSVIAFSVGESFCEIETDKAVVSFDAVDSGFVARILKKAKVGEIQIGEAIMITTSTKADAALVMAVSLDDILASFPKKKSSQPVAAAAPSPQPVAKPVVPPTAPVQHTAHIPVVVAKPASTQLAVTPSTPNAPIPTNLSSIQLMYLFATFITSYQIGSAAKCVQ